MFRFLLLNILRRRITFSMFGFMSYYLLASELIASEMYFLFMYSFKFMFLFLTEEGNSWCGLYVVTSILLMLGEKCYEICFPLTQTLRKVGICPFVCLAILLIAKVLSDSSAYVLLRFHRGFRLFLLRYILLIIINEKSLIY